MALLKPASLPFFIIAFAIIGRKVGPPFNADTVS
jgi:hypothetical protein